MKRNESIEAILKRLAGSIVFVKQFSEMTRYSPIYVRRVLRKLTRQGLALPKPNPSDPKRVMAFYLLPILKNHPFHYKNSAALRESKETPR
jgi:DNA-binding MarR family transcriptional regulator